MKSTKRNRRPSEQALQVAACLLADPDGWHYGYSLSQRTGLPSGTLYPILMRLAGNGLMETRWEDPERAGRPPRHLYRLSGRGAKWAREAMKAPASLAPALRAPLESAR